MSVYGRILVRAVIFFALGVAAVILSKPDPVLAQSTCCLNCETQFEQCIRTCRGNASCMDACDAQANRCVKLCPPPCPAT